MEILRRLRNALRFPITNEMLLHGLIKAKRLQVYWVRLLSRKELGNKSASNRSRDRGFIEYLVIMNLPENKPL